MSRRGKPRLEDLVRDALRNAGANGYSFKGWAPEMIAADMKDADALIAPHHIDDVTKVVKRLRR